MRDLRLARYLVSYKNKKLLKQALDLIRKHAPSHEIYAIYWQEKNNKLHISNGDWAEYDTDALFQALEKLLGKKNITMEAESGPPRGDNSKWVRIDPDTGKVRRD